ncbi:hypothetical protein DCAR_0205528 [Daucus carota subsp. sativus]|uniref:Oberon-like PHD finger domain-containing protein n=1 Tax=Daucus carota subsp. sativus TaxID=79200 RepID=A0AAF1AN78_DAUCS|nr:hypothetical protein DCAR_0205528 [Daucus carota subsp. sativus]
MIPRARQQNTSTEFFEICDLKSNVAGIVGALDAEYCCRCCDTRTDMLPHVKKFLQLCESISFHDIKKIFNLGVRVLHDVQRSAA